MKHKASSIDLLSCNASEQRRVWSVENRGWLPPVGFGDPEAPGATPPPIITHVTRWEQDQMVPAVASRAPWTMWQLVRGLNTAFADWRARYCPDAAADTARGT